MITNTGGFGKLNSSFSGKSSAPAVLFLHGFMGSISDWEEIISRLSSDFFCLALDLPGHGLTRECPSLEAYSMQGAAQAVVASLDAAGIQRCAFVGYSMGGRLALYLAIRFPNRCTRVVMESASPGIRSASEREQRKHLDERQAQLLESGDFESFLHSWYSQPLFESLTRDPDRYQQMLLERRRNDPFELAKSLRWMGAGVQPPLWESLLQLGIPLLVLAGEYDGKYRQIAGDMARLCRTARAAVVPDAGHNVHAENPKAYTRALSGFLTEKG